MFRRYFDSYLSLFGNEVMLYATRERPLSLLQIPPEDAINIIKNADNLIHKEPILLNLHSPIVVVGDLHGQFLDLIRIFQKNGIPPGKKFLFLGDLVDRGEFSFDILIFLFLLKIIHPDSIYFIRGNHEFNSLASTMGFFDEIIDRYNDPTLFNAFINVFNYFPLGAIINDKILCIHGGLGPNFTSISQIQHVYRPLCEFGKNDVADDILWSDPSNDIDTYEPNCRGAGWIFGKSVVDKFCSENNIDMIIRGHECVMHGYENFFGGKLITVFSASNSVGTVGNEAAVIEIKNPPLNQAAATTTEQRSTYVIMAKQYPPLPYLTRDQVFYTNKLRITPMQSQLPIFSKPRDPALGPLNLRRYQPPQPPAAPHPPVAAGGSTNPRKLSRSNFHAHSNKDLNLRTKMCQDSDQIRAVSNSAKNLPTWAIPSDLMPERSILLSKNDGQDQKLPCLNKQPNRHSFSCKSKKFNATNGFGDETPQSSALCPNNEEKRFPNGNFDDSAFNLDSGSNSMPVESRSRRKKPGIVPLNSGQHPISASSMQKPPPKVFPVRRPNSNRKRKRPDEI